jgi:hypothetical protein
MTVSFPILKLEELVVAPWNCSTLQEVLPHQKENIKKDPEILAYVEAVGLDVETLLQTKKHVGTSLVDGACKLGQTLCLERLQVSSLPETALFYHKVGLSPFDFHPLAFFKNLR